MNILLSLLFVISASAASFDHSHPLWNQVISSHVTLDGGISSVNYKAIKQAPQVLEDYLKALQSVAPEQFEKFSDPEKLAFLINAYNAFTVKLIVDNYPVDSIKDLGGTFSSVFKKEYIQLLGKKMSLDAIEHGTIRAKFQEPRIHFVVNCASKSCPPLRNEALTASKLEQQLEDNTTRFFQDVRRNRFNEGENELQLSKILDWYGDDFKKKHGSVKTFVISKMAKSDAEREKMKNADISFNKYDWKLNSKE